VSAPVIRRWIWGLVALVPLLLVGCMVWILATPSGLRWAVRTASPLLPAELSIGAVDGRLLGTMQLRDVRYRDDIAGIDVTVVSVQLKLRLRALLSRSVHIESAQIRGAVVALSTRDKPPTQEKAKPPGIDIHLDDLKVEDLQILRDQQTLLHLDRTEVIASLVDSQVTVRKLTLRSVQLEADITGTAQLAEQYTGSGTGHLRWKQADRSWAGDCTVNADAAAIALEARLQEPAAATLALRVAHEPDAPWQFRLDVPRVDPRGTLTSEESVESFAAHVEGSGTLLSGDTTGEVSINGLDIGIDTLHYARDADAIHLDGKLRVGGGNLEAKADLAISRTPLSGALTAAWRDITLPASLVGQVLRTNGSTNVSGTLLQFESRSDLTLWQGRRPTRLQANVRRNASDFLLDQLRITQTAGRLDATGRIATSGDVSWDIQARAQDFDPGALAAEWPGRVEFDLKSRGRLDGKLPVGTFDLTGLQGRLRDRTVSGEAQLQIERGLKLSGSAVLQSGGSTLRVNGARSDGLAVQAQFDIATLDDWLPNTHGALHGKFAVDGKWPDVAIAGSATGNDLQRDAVQIGALALELDIRNFQQRAGRADLSLEHATASGYALDTLNLMLDGDATEHRIALRSTGPRLSADFTTVGSWSAPYWRGHFDTLKLRLPEIPEIANLSLEQPFDLQLSRDSALLSRTCLAQGDVHLCLAGDAGAQGFQHGAYSVAGLPVAVANAFLPADFPLRFEGEVNGAGDVSRNAEGAFTGSAAINMDQGRILRLVEDEATELLAITGLALNGNFAGTNVQGRIAANIGQAGRVQAELQASGLGEVTTPVSGEITVSLPDLKFVNIEGSADLRARLAGTLDAPELTGALTGRNLGASIAPLGLALRNGNITISADGTKPFLIAGSVESDGKALRIAGEATRSGEANIRLQGENILAADIPGVRILASPDLTLQRTAERLTLNGTVRVPTARFDLKRMPRSTSSGASPDVVVIDDPEPPEKRSLLPLFANVTLEVGDDVKITGFGLDAQLDGRVAVRDRPGEVTTGSGELRLQGKYAAYGTELAIERGQMLFAGTPLANPRLDMRATRTIDEVVVGLNAKGEVAQPEITVFSNPTMADADAISYLIAGRPLAQVGSGADNAGALQSAARSLGIATSGALTRNLGKKLGVDALSIEESAALGGAAFTVGHYLSPRLYVGYGVALFTPGEVISMRYRLRDQLTIESETTQESSRVGVKLRIER
jgi:translocation and assembly module TamB